jgi:PAS domain S-box-containing protein
MDKFNRSIFDSLTDPALIIDGAGRIKNANRAFMQCFASDAGGIIGQHCYHVLFNRTDPCEKDLCPVAGDAGSGRGEYRFSVEGSDVFYEVDYRPFSGERGWKTAWLLTMRNVSVRRRLAVEVEKSEKKYKDLFHNAREGLALFSDRGVIQECNHSLARLLGYARKELEGVHAGRLTFGYSRKIFEDFLDGLKTMSFVSVELEMLKKNGERVPVEADINWLPYEGLFRIMVRDVTMKKKIEWSRKTYSEMLEKEVEEQTRELKDSEQEMRRQKKTAEGILRGTPIPMFVLDRNHRVMYWNRACEKLTGFSSREMVGKDHHWKPFYSHKRPLLADLVMEGDLKAITAMYKDMNLRASPMIDGAYEAEHFFPSLGSRGIHLHINAAPIMDDTGKIQGAIVTYQDLSEIHRLQKEKAQAERMAAIGRTVAGLAHYIKNVLTGLDGGAYVINSAISKRNMQLVENGWDMVERNIEQISGIVTDMLIYSRERTPDYRMSCPNELVAEVLELAYQRAKLSGVSLVRDLDTKLQPVAMDRTGIYRCLLNLISNAVDACTLEGIVHGKGVVRVRTDRPPGWGVRFQVTDNGTGMDEATRKKLFTEFFTTKGYKGTGLGLPVTHKIVQEHGGSLSFESEPGRGTTFSLMLPEKSLV